MAEETATWEIVDAATVFGFRTGRGADVSLSVLLGEMRKHNVKRACTISTLGILVDFELGNRETFSACRENAALMPMATVDPRRHVGCVEGVEKAAAQGCGVFALFPDTQGWPADSQSGCALARAICATGAALAIEASRPGGPSAVMRAVGDVDARVLLTGVNHVNLGEALRVAKAHAGIHFCTWSLPSVGSLETIAEQVGVERIIFGSRMPLNYFSSAYLRVRYGCFTEEEKQAIFSRNISRFLGRAT